MIKCKKCKHCNHYITLYTKSFYRFFSENPGECNNRYTLVDENYCCDGFLPQRVDIKTVISQLAIAIEDTKLLLKIYATK